jgi:NodT family efflux transporter outer membrane factor (OMF) lipoprotein
MKLNTFFILALGALATTGCSLTPSYHPPSMNVPVKWDNALASRTALVDQDPVWWKSFGPELAALEDEARANNNDLKISIARIEQARANVQAAQAALLPTLGLSSTSSRGTGNSSSPARPTTNGEALFVASYELPIWGKATAATNSQEETANAAQFDARATRLTLMADVANSYFSTLALNERLELAQTLENNARENLQLVEEQVKLGASSQLDLQNAQASLEPLTRNVTALKAAATLQKNALALLVGSTPESFQLAAGPRLEDILAPAVNDTTPATVLSRRPDIRAAEARLKAANFDIGVARADLLPSLSLSSQGGLGGAALNSMFGGASVWSLAASLTQPIFEGGRLRAVVNYDKAVKTEAEASYREAMLNALQDVEDARVSSVQTHDSVISAQTEVKAADQSVALTKTRVELGADDQIALLTAQRTALQSHDTLLQARLSQLQSSVGLYRSLAGGY